MALLALLLLAQAPTDGGTNLLVIWRGGTTRGAAEASLATLKAHADIAAHIDFPEGYPRIIESATVAGLTPGFFVVGLGVCASEATHSFVMLDAWAPAVYSRAVSLPLA